MVDRSITSCFLCIRRPKLFDWNKVAYLQRRKRKWGERKSIGLILFCGVYFTLRRISRGNLSRHAVKAYKSILKHVELEFFLMFFLLYFVNKRSKSDHHGLLCEDYRVVCLRYVILCIQADTSYYKIEETR